MVTSFSNPKLRQWRSDGQCLEIMGHSIFYREKGQGEPILMIHGFPTSSWDWQDVFEPLSQNFRVIAPDMLGYGFSSKPKNANYATAMQADIILAFIRELDIQTAHILTYSFGCSVVQEIMARELDKANSGFKLTSITFLNGGLFPASNHPNRTQKLLLSPLGRIMPFFMKKDSLERNLKAIFGPHTQPADQLVTDYWELLDYKKGRARIPKLIGYLRDRKTQASKWRQALINHPAPQHLIIGMTDVISGPKVAAEYIQTREDPFVTKLENIGHYPQLEKPDVVISALKALAANITPGPVEH